METQYIVTLVTMLFFVALVIIYAVTSYHRRIEEWNNRQQLENLYVSGAIATMEYDFAVYDEETERLIANDGRREEGQLTFDDVLDDGRIIGKLDGESIEEITGNYKPE